MYPFPFLPTQMTFCVRLNDIFPDWDIFLRIAVIYRTSVAKEEFTSRKLPCPGAFTATITGRKKTNRGNKFLLQKCCYVPPQRSSWVLRSTMF